MSVTSTSYKNGGGGTWAAGEEYIIDFEIIRERIFKNGGERISRIFLWTNFTVSTVAEGGGGGDPKNRIQIILIPFDCNRSIFDLETTN